MALSTGRPEFWVIVHSLMISVFQAKECQTHLENVILSKFPIEILLGKKNLEVIALHFITRYAPLL
jgi:hypothetical protein